MDANEILECQFSRWYPQFHDIAFRSTIIQLPAAFVDYLVQDGVFLGNGSRAVSGNRQLSVRPTHSIAVKKPYVTALNDLQMLRRAEPASDDVYTEWSDSSHDAVEEQPRVCASGLAFSVPGSLLYPGLRIVAEHSSVYVLRRCLNSQSSWRNLMMPSWTWEGVLHQS